MRAMSEMRVDGVIISSSHIDMKRLKQLDHYGIPSVLINNQEMLEPDTYSVYNDDAYAMNQILQHVIGLGHKRIAYLGSPRAGRTNAERQHGFEEALSQAGLKLYPGYVSYGEDGRPQGGAQGMRKLPSTRRDAHSRCLLQ